MRTKPFGENMEQESAQELICGNRHDLLLAAVGIVFPAKRDAIILESHQTMVGDGDAMGVAGQIVQHMFGTAEGWLGVDDPVLAEERDAGKRRKRRGLEQAAGVSRGTGACAGERVAAVRLRTCRGRRDSVRATGRKKRCDEWIHREPSGARPPAGTT